MEQRDLARVLILVGLAALVLGAAAWFGLLNWFGRLPGDLRYEGERARVYVPLASMLVVSVVTSVVLALMRRL